MANPVILINEKGKRIDETNPLAVRGMNSLVPVAWDAWSKASVDSVTDLYTYRVGGQAGMIVATVTVVYADSSKTDAISSTTVVP